MQPNLKSKNGELTKGSTGTGTDSLRHHRNQTPQEALGITGKGGLFKASIQAGILFAIVFAVLTVVPYFMSKQGAAAKVNAPAGPEKVEDATPPVAPQPKTTPTPEITPKTPTGKIPGKDDLLNKLGETGTKNGTPKTKDPFKAGGEDDLPGLK